MREPDSITTYGLWAILVLGLGGNLLRFIVVGAQSRWQMEFVYNLFGAVAADIAIVIGLFLVVRILATARLR